MQLVNILKNGIDFRAGNSIQFHISAMPARVLHVHVFHELNLYFFFCKSERCQSIPKLSHLNLLEIFYTILSVYNKTEAK